MLNAEWLKAFAPIGVLRGKEWMALGAGTFLHHPSAVWFATAEHVIKRAGEEDLAVLVTRPEGGLIPVNLTTAYRDSGLAWITDPANDIAIGLMPLAPEYDIKSVDRKHCMVQAEIVPSMTAYTVGCPYGLRGLDPGKSHPLVLSGVIAGSSPTEGTLYCSAPTFPGNSGGPLLVELPPHNSAGGAVFGRPTLYLAGMVRELSLIASDEHPALPALHLGICTAIDAVLALLDSGAARDHLKKIGVPESNAPAQ